MTPKANNEHQIVACFQFLDTVSRGALRVACKCGRISNVNIRASGSFDCMKVLTPKRNGEVSKDWPPSGDGSHIDRFHVFRQVFLTIKKQCLKNTG